MVLALVFQIGEELGYRLRIIVVTVVDLEDCLCWSFLEAVVPYELRSAMPLFGHWLMVDSARWVALYSACRTESQCDYETCALGRLVEYLGDPGPDCLVALEAWNYLPRKGNAQGESARRFPETNPAGRSRPSAVLDWCNSELAVG